MKEKRVMLAMSGGTDSSVAAMLLLEKGYEVEGVTFRMWDVPGELEPASGTPLFIEEARELAKKLGISHHVVDLRKEFKEDIISYFKEEYLSGRTPHPCARCNRTIKWHYLKEWAERQECYFLATGHYVKLEKKEGYFYVKAGVDEDKDQSFFLWGLDQEKLKRALFPLGDLKKEEVREIAHRYGYKRVAEKKDSMGACFVDQMDYRPFLRKLVPDIDEKIGKGAFVDIHGNILGTHLGYPYYTVGQRRGLGIHLNRAVYVKQIDPVSNSIVLAGHKDLFHQEFIIKDCCFVHAGIFESVVISRIRYRKQATPAQLSPLKDGRVRVTLLEPLDAIAPGQTAVFYDEDRVLGGGFIDEVI